MDTKTAIKTALANAEMISMGYLEDLTDAEMMHRPAEGCNHIKWQLGHLIHSENRIMNSCYPESMPPLPDGFAEKYDREKCDSDDANGFDDKATLLDIYRQQRAGTLALLEQVDVDELSQPGPESIRSYAPTLGAAFLMQDSHWVMHAGQWAVIRRQLGRKPLF